MKYELLCWLVAPSPFSPLHRLGAVWLWLVDQGGTTDERALALSTWTAPPGTTFDHSTRISTTGSTVKGPTIG